MTDVQTDPTPSTRARKDVKYASDFPEYRLLNDEEAKSIRKPREGGYHTGPRRSNLDKQVELIREAFPQGTNGAWVVMAIYGNGGAGAAAAKQALQKRWGNEQKHMGIKFKTQRVSEDESNLLVKYDPTAVEDGAVQAYYAEKGYEVPTFLFDGSSAKDDAEVEEEELDESNVTDDDDDDDEAGADPLA